MNNLDIDLKLPQISITVPKRRNVERRMACYCSAPPPGVTFVRSRHCLQRIPGAHRNHAVDADFSVYVVSETIGNEKGKSLIQMFPEKLPSIAQFVG